LKHIEKGGNRDSNKRPVLPLVGWEKGKRGKLTKPTPGSLGGVKKKRVECACHESFS